MKTFLKKTSLVSALVLASAATAIAQEAGAPDFSPITEAANWSEYVVPAIMGIAGAIAGVLVVISGIKYVLGAIRRA